MTSDSIRIAGNDHFSPIVSSKMQFTDTFSASKAMNTGLDKMTTSYITGSHFKPGYGGFNGQSENKRAYFAPSGPVRGALSPERVQFFKDTHFDHCDKKMPMMNTSAMKGSFDAKDMSAKRSINEGNNAWSLRNKVHDNGKIGNQSTNYVTDAQMRYKWVQPSQSDYGATASMGLIPGKK